MTRGLRNTALLAGCAAVLLVGSRASCQTTNVAPGSDYSAFKRILDNNIFNTKRSPRYVPTEQRETPRSRTESFALVGTMNYQEKGPLAFFEGSSSAYKKVLKPQETIAGFKIEGIERAMVRLATPSNQIELHIGMELRRQEEGEWKLGQRPEVISEAPRTTTSSRPASAGVATRAPDTNSSARDDAAARNADLSQLAPSLPPGAVDGLDRGQGQAQTNVAPSGTAPTPGSGADILEILRRRREQENQ
jgi:hypothetical protein